MNYEKILKHIINKVENYDRLKNEDSSFHVHTDMLVYDIKKILWEYLLKKDLFKRVYFYPSFWNILKEDYPELFNYRILKERE